LIFYVPCSNSIQVGMRDMVDHELSREEKDLLRLTPQFPLLFAKAVFFGKEPTTRDIPSLMNGTASLVKLGGHYLGITCKHVLDAYRAAIDRETRRVVFQIGGCIIDPLPNLISESNAHDLVSICLDNYVGTQDLSAADFIEPSTWPPGDVEVGSFVMFGGFPGVWRKQAEPREVEFGSFSSGGSEVHSVQEDYFYARIEMELCVDFLTDNKSVPNLGGLSGGPVFAWRTLHCELVGFIQEYSQDYDLLYIRKAGVMSADGTYKR
jgi:hypothetical protein